MMSSRDRHGAIRRIIPGVEAWARSDERALDTPKL
jgi:hypothetical protein